MAINSVKRFRIGAALREGALPCSRAFIDLCRRFWRTGTRALLLAGLLSFVAVVSSAQVVTIKEYPLLDSSSVPTSITAGPDGALWFLEYRANKVGRITTAGIITEYPVGMVGGDISQLHQITPGPDGALWFTESYASKIGRITTAGVITEYDTPTDYSWPLGITAGRDGALWFTEIALSRIGRITTSGTITEYPLPAGRAPTDITVGSDGALWFMELAANQIGRMTMDGVLTAEYPLPPRNCYCVFTGAVTAGPDGVLWFVNDIDKIGRISTTGIVKEYTLAPNSWPEHLTAGPDGALWFTESGPGNIARITNSGTIKEYPIPTDYPLPGGLTVGPDGNLWFTESSPGKIGQVILLRRKN